MKSITNYLNAPSSFYKSVTKGEVILTHIICTLLLLVVALAESHPFAATFLAILIGAIIFLTKTAPKKDNQ